MKRNLYVGAIFLAVLGTLIVASVFLEKKAAVEAAGVMAPRFEVDPLWPKPLPNHWILGQTSAYPSTRRITSGSFTAPDRSKPAKSTQRPIRRLRSAALRRLPSWNSIRQEISSPVGAARPGLRLAGIESRHHDRLQRQRLDRRQRRECARRGTWTGRSRSTRRRWRSAQDEGQAGGLGTNDSHGSEIHAGRKVPDADRQARPEQRQQRHRKSAAAGEDLHRSNRPTKSMSPMATAITASSSSTPNRKIQAALGSLRQ